MIWVGLSVVAAALAVLALVVSGQTGVFGSLLGAVDDLHSDLKAEKLATEARRELAERQRKSGGGDA